MPKCKIKVLFNIITEEEAVRKSKLNCHPELVEGFYQIDNEIFLLRKIKVRQVQYDILFESYTFRTVLP